MSEKKHKINWLSPSVDPTGKLTEEQIAALRKKLQPGVRKSDSANAFRRYLTPLEFEWVAENVEGYYYVEVTFEANNDSGSPFGKEGYVTVVFAIDKVSAEAYMKNNSIWPY